TLTDTIAPSTDPSMATPTTGTDGSSTLGARPTPPTDAGVNPVVTEDAARSPVTTDGESAPETTTEDSAASPDATSDGGAPPDAQTAPLPSCFDGFTNGDESDTD